MILNYKKVGSGKPLFFLHGLFGSSSNWFSFSGAALELLSQKHQLEFQSFLIDQRNHGKSFHSDSFNYSDMGNDLLGIMKHENLDRISLLGHSMGAKAAMQFALDHSKKTEKLIVVDIATKYYAPHHSLELEAMSSLDLSAITSRDEADEQMKTYIKDEGARQFLLQNLDRDDDNNFRWRINLELFKREIKHIGAEIKSANHFSGPCLFVAGEKSDYISEGDKPDILKLFPNAEFISIPGAGHWVHVDQPETLLKVVADILAAT